jgi:hypothetical protein
MLDKNEGHVGIVAGRQACEKGFESGQASGRSTDPNDGKGDRYGRG